MTITEIKKGIKGVFKPPVKEFYFGKLRYGTPYFWPINFCSTIIYIRKLKRKTQDEIIEYRTKYPRVSGKEIEYSNIPMCRRTWDKIITLFGHDYFIQWGWPIKLSFQELGWKDKFGSPRFEWCPSFKIFFFGLQFCIFWRSPIKDKFEDQYWEQILWYIHYANKDITKAKKTWPWNNYETKISSWDDDYLI